MESEGSDSSNNKIEGKYSTKMMKKAVNTAIEKFGKGLGRWETVDDVTNLEPIASSTPRERDYNEERILPGPSDAQLKRIHERIGYTQGETSNDSFESSSEDFHRNRNRIDDFDEIDNRKKNRPDFDNGNNFGRHYTDRRYEENSHRPQQWDNFNRLQASSPNGLITPEGFAYPPPPMEGNEGSANMDLTCMDDNRLDQIRNEEEIREYPGKENIDPRLSQQYEQGDVGRDSNAKYKKMENQSTLPYKSINHGRRNSCETIHEEEFPEQNLDLSLGEKIKNMFKGGRNPDSDSRRKKVQWSDLDERRELPTNEERNYNNPRSMHDRDFLRRSTYKNQGCDWNRNQFANDYDRFYGEKRSINFGEKQRIPKIVRKFNEKDSNLWIKLLENSFKTHCIKDENVMLEVALNNMESEQLSKLKPWLNKTNKPYTSLKEGIKTVFAEKPISEKVSELMSAQMKVNQTPKEFMANLLSRLDLTIKEIGPQMTGLVRQVFLNALPGQIKLVTSSVPENSTLDHLAEVAQRCYTQMKSESYGKSEEERKMKVVHDEILAKSIAQMVNAIEKLQIGQERNEKKINERENDKILYMEPPKWNQGWNRPQQGNQRFEGRRNENFNETRNRYSPYQNRQRPNERQGVRNYDGPERNWRGSYGVSGQVNRMNQQGRPNNVNYQTGRNYGNDVRTNKFSQNQGERRINDNGLSYNPRWCRDHNRYKAACYPEKCNGDNVRCSFNRHFL